VKRWFQLNRKKDDKKEDYSEDLEDFDYSFHGYFFLLAKAIHIALVLKHKDDDAIATISSRNDKTFWKLYEEVEEKRIAFHEWHDNEWIRNEINSRLIKNEQIVDMPNTEQNIDDTALYNNETSGWFTSVYERVYSNFELLGNLSPW